MLVEGTADSSAIITAVEQAGYGAEKKVRGAQNPQADGSSASASDALADKETPKMKRRLIASLCFLIPLMYLSMGHMMWGWWIGDFLANNMLAQGKTAPGATDAQGKVLMDKETGKPKRMVYNYSEGSQTYQFQGGDLIYEDINHDGQINQLDVVYLGNSQPKVNGGFNLTLKYGNFSIKGRFMYRFGNKVVNFARMELEKMYTTYNQSATVNYRWRKDGDVTPMPRAMYNTAYNWQGSDRYVEDGSFVRFQNLQLAYSFPSKQIKKLGINQLQLYFSMDNLYCWTKYSGTDPEVSPKGWGVAEDKSQTPRAKQFTASINIGF